MGKQIFRINFAILLFVFVFTAISAHASNNFYTSSNFTRILEKLCAVKIKIHEKYPRIPVPHICKTKSPKLPTLELLAEPASITEGESATLSWASDHTLSCEASGGWTGDKILSGEEVVSPLVTTTYTLTCDGVNEGIEKSVIVDVTPLPPPPPPPDPEPVDPNNGHVVINEIAWMGTIVDNTANANAEWIELRNLGSVPVDMSGWTLVATDGTPNISLSSSCTNTVIPASGFFLLVRTNPTILGKTADCVFTGAMGNTGEVLTLSNSASTTIDSVNGNPNWEIGGAPMKGNNTSKETAQRLNDGTWTTLAPTPGQ